jgi:hypothetical protein
MLKETIHNAFYFKNGSQRDKFVLAAQMKWCNMHIKLINVIVLLI